MLWQQKRVSQACWNFKCDTNEDCHGLTCCNVTARCVNNTSVCADEDKQGTRKIIILATIGVLWFVCLYFVIWIDIKKGNKNSKYGFSGHRIKMPIQL